MAYRQDIQECEVGDYSDEWKIEAPARCDEARIAIKRTDPPLFDSSKLREPTTFGWRVFKKGVCGVGWEKRLVWIRHK